MKRISLVFFLLFVSACQSITAPKQTLQFALIGDNPYQEYNFPKYRRLIDRINETPGVEWVVHLGDMKDSVASCADANMMAIRALNENFQVPFVLTPGDNDWFDCGREGAGSFDRRERLTALRRTFFSESSDLPLVRQSESEAHMDFIENVYWVQNDVLFATVHLVGLTGQEGGLDIHGELMTAGIAWLDEIFLRAAEMNVKGVFIGTQADIYPISAEKSLLSYFCPQCPVVHPLFDPIHNALLRHARVWKGPILMGMGDTHIFRVDKPLYDGDDVLENFTRVEVFGEGQVHWVRVEVDPSTSEVFSIHQELIDENLGVGWSEADKEK